MFKSSSRYHALKNLVYTDNSGRERVYKERRMVRGATAVPGEMAERGRTTLAQSERLDLIAQRTLGDAERFWLLCDANRVMNPSDLSGDSGFTLVIPDV